MLKNKKLTYISLFSSAGIGCYGFKQAGFECVATNELIERRINIQRFNKKCKYESGYICGDLTLHSTKNLIYREIDFYKKLGNDCVDVLIATPPCQGMSVANHKKKNDEIIRNSLVVESIDMTKDIKPRFFVFENVSSFLGTGCTTRKGDCKSIGKVIDEELGNDYEIMSKVLNFKSYGGNSSRTRTLVIGVRHDLSENISPLEIFPAFQCEKSLRTIIGDMEELEWGEISNDDIYHFFRVYNKKMVSWISELKEGESAFDNTDPLKIPHQVINGKMVINKRKNGDKYKRQYWNKVAPCIHTRNDLLASQNTIHPRENRVFSIRELMRLMTIPDDFKWSEIDFDILNRMSHEEKKKYLKKEEMKIRQSIGEAVPTAIFNQVAINIKKSILENDFKLNFKELIAIYKLENKDNLFLFIEENPLNLSISLLTRLVELSNSKRKQNAAYYTNKILLNKIYEQMPDFDQETVNILEPSVGAGNFLPYIFKKYEHVNSVVLDVVDIDEESIVVLKKILKRINVPKNIKINFIAEDYLSLSINKRYDLIIGNPPFSKISNRKKSVYDFCFFNDRTLNLSALFLEKSINYSNNVCMVLPKNILNTPEFVKSRKFLEKFKINSIYDFGEKGFKGVLIETVCISISTRNKPGNTQIINIPKKIKLNQKQKYFTDNKYPYWILYRNEFFDEIANKITFNKFEVFRDRQITKANSLNFPTNSTIRVLKSKNITDDGKIVNIDKYDLFIESTKACDLAVWKFLNMKNVFLVPNMTYNPRMIRKPKNVLVNGSLAILIPKDESLYVSNEQIEYFASKEYRNFYRIARNYQTRSLNIDATSVYFFGLLKGE